MYLPMSSFNYNIINNNKRSKVDTYNIITKYIIYHSLGEVGSVITQALDVTNVSLHTVGR